MQCCFPFLQGHKWDTHINNMGRNHCFWKQTGTGNLLGERLFVGERKEAMGSMSGCFLALLEAVCLFCCFLFPFHCEEHSPWRKQALPSSLKAVCYSSCLITNYVTSTHLNPRAEGLQTFRESDEAAKSQFTLNISQIATNHRQSPLCSSGSGAVSNPVNQCPCCLCSPGEHRTCGGRR